MKKIILFITLIAAIIIISSLVIAPNIKNSMVDVPVVEQEDEEEVGAVCLIDQGNWLEDQEECEYVGKDWCDNHGGTFSECGSACRHHVGDEPAVCTLQCVPFCKFNAVELSLQTARSLVISTWGACDDCDNLIVNVNDNNIEALYEGMKDDSVKNIKRTAQASFVDNAWVIANQGETEYICQDGRGQAEYSVELCN